MFEILGWSVNNISNSLKPSHYEKGKPCFNYKRKQNLLRSPVTNSISATFTFARLLGQILVRTGFYKILLPRNWRLPLWVVLVFPMKKLDINLEFSCSPLPPLSEPLPNLFKWIQLLFSLSFICCFCSILFFRIDWYSSYSNIFYKVWEHSKCVSGWFQIFGYSTRKVGWKALLYLSPENPPYFLTTPADNIRENRSYRRQ